MSVTSKISTVVLRVANAHESADYLQKHFGVSLLKKGKAKQWPDVNQEGTIQSKEALFVGFDKPTGGAHIGLIHDPDTELNVGEGYGHLAVASPTIYQTCDTIKKEGGKVTREPGPVKGGTTEIAFVEAPGGWKYELINRDDSWVCPMLHLMVRVGDLERSSKFYAEAFGMQVLRESINEAYKYTLKFVGPGREEENTVFEFTYNWGKTEYNLGNAHAYTELTLTSGTLEDVVSKIEEGGGKVVEKTETNVTCTDPDGYTLVICKE